MAMEVRYYYPKGQQQLTFKKLEGSGNLEGCIAPAFD
jgi:hypothetical protein